MLCRADSIVRDAEAVRVAVVPADNHNGRMSERLGKNYGIEGCEGTGKASFRTECVPSGNAQHAGAMLSMLVQCLAAEEQTA